LDGKVRLSEEDLNAFFRRLAIPANESSDARITPDSGIIRNGQLPILFAIASLSRVRKNPQREDNGGKDFN